MKSRIARWRSDRGAEFVEFALVFPLLLLVVMGLIDFGIMFQQYIAINNGAREGARIAILPNYSSADAQSRALQYINATLYNNNGGTASATVGAATLTALPSGQCVTTITVTTSYPHGFFYLTGIAGYFGGSFGTKTLTASATMRTEASAGACS